MSRVRRQRRQQEEVLDYELASESDDWEMLHVPEICTPTPAAAAVEIKPDYFAAVADDSDVENPNSKVSEGDVVVGSEDSGDCGFLLLDASEFGDVLDLGEMELNEVLDFEDNLEEGKQEDSMSAQVREGPGRAKHDEIEESLHFEGDDAEIDEQHEKKLHLQGTSASAEAESLDLEEIAAAMDANERQRVEECSHVARSEGDGKPVVDEIEKVRGVEWWKVPLELSKYWGCKVRPLWSISMVVAFVGCIMLGRRLKRMMMRRKSRGIPLKLVLDEARASQFAARTARLNKAFSVAGRISAIRTPSLAEVTPWSVVELR